MAQRDYNFTPDVNRVVAEAPDQMLEGIAAVGAQLAETSAKSKMLAASAKTQTQFKKLDAEFRLMYADDPTNTDGLRNLEESRKEVIDTQGEGIPIIYNRQWQEQAGEMSLQSTLGNDLWGADQQRENVVKNINDSIQTYLSSASTDGMAFGKDTKAVLANTMNFLDARGRLEQVGQPIIGDQKTRKLLEEFDSDYVKTFVSGVVETSPQKGLELLNKPEIRDTFKKPEEYQKFKLATENRAKAVYANQQDGSVLDQIKNGNRALADGGKWTYAQLQQADLSDTAREYFERLNGFKGHGKRGGYTPEDKASQELAIFDAVANLQQDKNMDAQSVRIVQDAVYKGMNTGAITQSQGQDYITQIVEPLIKRKEEDMAQFGTGGAWYDPGDSIGFDGIQDFYENNVQRNTEGLSKDTALAVTAGNSVNRANLYDYYFGALKARANAAGVPVGDLSRLPRAQRDKVYSAAQNEAQVLFMKDRHPALRTMPDVPNFVYSNGQLIQGATGPRDVKAVKTAQPTFKLQKDTESGDIFRVYPNGQKELARKGGQ